MTFRANLSLLGVVTFLFIGCGSGSSDGAPNAGVQQTNVDSQISAHFFHLAVVPQQTVTATTFDVQVIAENADLNSPPTAPTVTDANGTKHTMALVMLQWPDNSGPSVQVYSAVVPLLANQLNSIHVTSGTKSLQFQIAHKSSLTIQTATNATDLQSKVKAAISDPNIDVIRIGYDEPDLGLVLDQVGRANGARIANQRTTWLTLEPEPGFTTAWNRDYPGTVNTFRRPYVNFLNLKGITFGSDTSDGGGYSLYSENNENLWLSFVQFRGKYKHTVSKLTSMTPVDALGDIRGSVAQGQKVYFTGCLWDGTASSSATFGAELARDLVFNSHRGDFNNFDKVFLNVAAQDINPIKISTGADFLHNDGFQIWQSQGTENLAFKGFKVTSPNVAAELQPFLFDRTGPTNYSNILVDNLTITGAPLGLVLRAQFAGVMSNSRISNISLDHQFITFRQDFTDPFTPSQVYLQNFNVEGFLHCPLGSACRSFTIANGYPSNITSQLSAISSLSGVTFSNMFIH